MTTASYREIAIAYLRFTPTSRDQLAEDFGVDADLDGLTRQKRDREISGASALRAESMSYGRQSDDAR